MRSAVAGALAYLTAPCLATALAACGGDPGTLRNNNLDGFVGTNPDMPKVGSPGGECTSAVLVADGTTLKGEDNRANMTTLPGVCAPGAAGKVRYYSATVPPGQKLSFTVTPTDGTFDPLLRLFDACGDTQCPASADSGGANEAETLSFPNTGASTRDVLIAVAGFKTGGGVYDVDVRIEKLPVNVGCSNAKPLVTGTPIVGEDASAGSDTISACLSTSNGGVLYYSTMLPARTELVVTVTPTGAGWDPSIRLLDSCAAADCLSAADSGTLGQVETLSYRNRTLMDKPIIIAVGGQAGVAGKFDLSIAENALPPPPVNVSCAMATVLADGTTLTAQDATEGLDDLTAACLSGATGGVLYYKATVPANSKLDVHVAPNGTSSIDSVIRILPSCGATSCLTTADAGYIATAETATYKNKTASAVSVIVAVDAYSSASSGDFDLDAHITALPPPPTNTSCASAISVADGTSLKSQNQEGATATETSLCLSGADGGVLFYKTSIPAGKKLLAQAKPTDFDAVIRLISSCSASSCLQSVDVGYTGNSEILSYKNTGGSSLPVVFTVGSYFSSTPGVFDLDVWMKSTPTNLTCASPMAVTNGTSLPAEDAESATASMTSACLPAAIGNTLFYSISIPAGKTLQVDVAPIGYWDPTIRVVSSCGATSCLASQDTGSSGTPESLMYINGTAASQAVTIAVGSYGSNTGPFSLSVAIK